MRPSPMRVIYLGMVNWIVTLILTRSSLFQPMRQLAAEVHPKLGELASCPLCAGTWVGFFQGLVFGGPFRAFVWNGFLYKAVGELCSACIVLVTSLNMAVAVAGHAQRQYVPQRQHMHSETQPVAQFQAAQVAHAEA